MTHTLYFRFQPQSRVVIDKRLDEWGGVVLDLPPNGRAKLKFGVRSGHRTHGRVVTLQAMAGQLLYSCRYLDNGDELRLFGLAWRDQDGNLVDRPIAREASPQSLFLAGGYREPEGDESTTLERITQLDMVSNPRAFEELCSITAHYMNAHLLVSPPKLDPAAFPDDNFAAGVIRTLKAHCSAWPQYERTLQAAAKKLDEWLRIPPN